MVPLALLLLFENALIDGLLPSVELVLLFGFMPLPCSLVCIGFNDEFSADALTDYQIRAQERGPAVLTSDGR